MYFFWSVNKDDCYQHSQSRALWNRWCAQNQSLWVVIFGVVLMVGFLYTRLQFLLIVGTFELYLRVSTGSDMSSFADGIINESVACLGNGNPAVNCRCSVPFCDTMTVRLLSGAARGLTASQFAFPAFPSEQTLFPSIAARLHLSFFSLEMRATLIWEDFHVHSVTEMYFGSSWGSD